MCQLGEAVTKNPGYLKLRKIRAAQNIAKTVRNFVCAAQLISSAAGVMFPHAEKHRVQSKGFSAQD